MKIRYFIVSLLAAIALSLYAHKAHANQAFSGPGVFIDPGCADIVSPVDGQTWCLNPTDYSITVYNAATATYQDPIAASNTTSFGGFSVQNIGGLGLVQQGPPGSVAAAGTCSGTCATTYTYEVSCVTDSGESLPSASVTAVNNASLDVSDFNTVTWSVQPACTGGYNVYGRTGGSLGLLGNVAAATGTFTDDGSAAAPVSYAFSFTSGSHASLAIWDLRGAVTNAPIDVKSTNAALSASLKATSVTTTQNHDLQIPVFGMGTGSGSFTNPGGFSNVANVASSSGARNGIWGGTKDIAAAGATGNATGTTVTASDWGAINIAVLSSNTASAITVEGSATAVTNASGTSLPFGDPTGTASGDVEVACISFGRGSLLSAPAGFNLIATAAAQSTGTELACYWNLPAGTPKPPTTNTTGIITQSTPSGTFRETLLGLIPWSANSANAPNGAGGVAQSSISFPVDMTVVSCRATWFQYSGCSPFPTFAIKDTTAGVVLCSTGTVSGTNTDQAITPTNFSVPANDVVAFLATTTGVGCTTGQSAMSVLFKE